MGINSAELWNLVNIVVLFGAAAVNFAYFKTHSNGKNLVRVWSAVVLLIILLIRAALALDWLDSNSFTDLLRPISNLLYMIPVLDAYVDWRRKA